MHLRDKDIYRKVQEIVAPDKWVRIKRKGKLYIQGRYIDWPLRYTAIYQLPFMLSFRIIFDQIFKKKICSSQESNFSNELLALYGPTLYYSFFHPLTKRFLRTNPEQVHVDWAFSSIRSATKIEDKSFSKSYKYLTETTDEESKKDFNVIKFFIKSLKMNKESEKFYYFKNGFGTLVDSYKEKIMELGGKIKTNTEIKRFIMNGDRVEKCVMEDGIYDMDYVIWTGNLFDMCKLLQIEKPKLSYLHSKFLYLFLKDCKKNHQVCYYADQDISFVRGTILSNHSKSIIKNKKISDLLCLEYTYKSEEEMYKDFNRVKQQAVADLKKVGIITDETSIENIYEINAPYSYPILLKDYKEHVNSLQKQVGRYKNVLPFGRQPTFNYENVDVIIKEAINHKFFEGNDRIQKNAANVR